jgi:hypothetical protein
MMMSIGLALSYKREIGELQARIRELESALAAAEEKLRRMAGKVTDEELDWIQSNFDLAFGEDFSSAVDALLAERMGKVPDGDK